MGENHPKVRSPPVPTMQLHRGTSLLLNLGHALDHMFLLIFATAVSSVAADFGFEHWEDLMPYSAGAFLLFGQFPATCHPIGIPMQLQHARKPGLTIGFNGHHGHRADRDPDRFHGPILGWPCRSAWRHWRYIRWGLP